MGNLIIIIVCIVMSAYFSATETAFSSFNRIRLKNMAENTAETVYGYWIARLDPETLKLSEV